MKDKFRNSKGELTHYALACGYIQQEDYKGIITTLWIEHGAIHVRQTNLNIGKRIFWECPSTLTEARTLYKKACIDARK